MQILYFHGLDSVLNPVKKEILEKYYTVISPVLDYRNNNQVVKIFYDKFKNEKIDVVMGTSMGGYVAYYLSFMLNLPCMVFNPALPYKNVLQFLPELKTERNKFLYVVLGKQDNIIKAKDSLEFLQNTTSKHENIRVTILNQLEHQIPIDVFESEINIFFELLKLNK